MSVVLSRYEETEWRLFHLCFALASTKVSKGLYYHTVNDLKVGMESLLIPYHIEKERYWHTFEPIPLKVVLEEYDPTIAQFLIFKINPRWIAEASFDQIAVIEEYVDMPLGRMCGFK